MSKICPNSKIRYCQRNLAMFWNMTKPGVLYAKSSINAGCGRSCAVAPDKSLPLSSATAVKRPVAAYGTRFQSHIVIAFPIVTSGRLIKKFFHRKHTMRLVKRVDRYRTWSVGIVLCANTKLAMFARHFHFRSMMPFITCSPNGLLSITILPSVSFMQPPPTTSLLFYTICLATLNTVPFLSSSSSISPNFFLSASCAL